MAIFEIHECEYMKRFTKNVRIWLDDYTWRFVCLRDTGGIIVQMRIKYCSFCSEDLYKIAGIKPEETDEGLSPIIY